MNISDQSLIPLEPHEIAIPDWQQAINTAVRKLLEYPAPTICRHQAIAILLEEFEAIGYPQPDAFVKAVVQADDETALHFRDVFERPAPPISQRPQS